MSAISKVPSCEGGVEQSETEGEKEQNFLYNLKYLRKSDGISKRKMAKLLGIGIGSLNKIESGKLPPRLGVSVFFDAQRLFGITPQEQLSGRLGD